jgi:hypothetical protein
MVKVILATPILHVVMLVYHGGRRRRREIAAKVGRS